MSEMRIKPRLGDSLKVVGTSWEGTIIAKDAADVLIAWSACSLQKAPPGSPTIKHHSRYDSSELEPAGDGAWKTHHVKTECLPSPSRADLCRFE